MHIAETVAAHKHGLRIVIWICSKRWGGGCATSRPCICQKQGYNSHSRSSAETSMRGGLIKRATPLRQKFFVNFPAIFYKIRSLAALTHCILLTDSPTDMALPGTRNRRPAAALSEQMVRLIPPSPTDHQPQESQMRLKSWDELRELHQVSRDDCIADLSQPSGNSKHLFKHPRGMSRSSEVNLEWR